MRRRDFLSAGAGLAAAALVASLWWRRKASAPKRVGADPPVFPPASLPVLVAVADAIVPRSGDHPAASEIDLMPRLLHLLRVDRNRETFYRSGWPRFEAELRARMDFGGAGPDPARLHDLLESWYAAYRAPGRPRPEVHFFEILRRDVLRAYYSSPAGWASVGYAGPVHRAPPTGGS